MTNNLKPNRLFFRMDECPNCDSSVINVETGVSSLSMNANKEYFFCKKCGANGCVHFPTKFKRI